ncbi:hypothetical protein BH10BAC5_BH10BAC5_14880 [soil metagenome]
MKVLPFLLLSIFFFNCAKYNQDEISSIKIFSPIYKDSTHLNIIIGSDSIPIEGKDEINRFVKILNTGKEKSGVLKFGSKYSVSINSVDKNEWILISGYDYKTNEKIYVADENLELICYELLKKFKK